jgi:hypothetical protein
MRRAVLLIALLWAVPALGLRKPHPYHRRVPTRACLDWAFSTLRASMGSD